ncbi:MAG TPA: ribosome-associated translation inhibitor RaiA [Gemmatimonadales bacterium]|jgi:ribosomal subunit interface protein
MQTTITSRREDVSEELKAQAEAAVDRLGRRAVRPTSAHVTFDTAKTGARVEIVLNAARGAVYVAKADAADHRTALDRALAKLQRQLEKVEANPARSRRKAAAS